MGTTESFEELPKFHKLVLFGKQEDLNEYLNSEIVTQNVFEQEYNDDNIFDSIIKFGKFDNLRIVLNSKFMNKSMVNKEDKYKRTFVYKLMENINKFCNNNGLKFVDIVYILESKFINKKNLSTRESLNTEVLELMNEVDELESKKRRSSFSIYGPNYYKNKLDEKRKELNSIRERSCRSALGALADQLLKCNGQNIKSFRVAYYIYNTFDKDILDPYFIKNYDIINFNVMTPKMLREIKNAKETICRFMYNSYFGPEGIFYKKQLEKIDFN